MLHLTGNLFFISFNLLAKFSYWADNSNIKNKHISADTNMVADMSYIPSASECIIKKTYNGDCCCIHLIGLHRLVAVL